ncbi:MAG TPA: FecR domain-containing protein [Candidatus Polarisedimenticolia bacterium]|nr:FecR domain-containing protein [Candidatus Polarisedimenticolia bacterium]
MTRPCYLQFDYAKPRNSCIRKPLCYIEKLERFAAHSTVTTQTPIDPRFSQDHQRTPRVEVYWKAVTYKTVIVYVLLALTIIIAGIFAIKPDLYQIVIKKLDKAVSDPEMETQAADLKHAKFVNLDGKVQVKKVNSVQWVEADYRTSLDKGDLVQTGSDANARITFADGTTYTVKPDTLVTVEENSTENDKPTSVAMQINHGAVDLATPNWSSPDSRAGVSAEDAHAQLHSNSRAAVKSDPEKKESEIVVSSGSAQVQRGQEKIDLTQYEKLTIPKGRPVQKTMVLAPPDLVEPLNLSPITAENPRLYAVHFEWKPVPDAVSYTLRISTTAMFTKTVKEPTTKGTTVDVTGLDPGDYFWSVTATDGKKQTSEVSTIFKFTLVAQGKTQDMVLEITSTQVVGQSAEIVGRTEPGAALIINGQSVPNIAPDGNFRHFTDKLAPGQHTISIIGANRRGGTATKQVSIVVPK